MKAVAVFLLVLCYLAVSHAWMCKEAPRLYNAQQVDAGQGKVVARDPNYAYFLISSRWYRMGYTRFKHVTVGPAGLWGVDTSNRVHKFVAGNFQQASGISMLQVDAGGDDQLVGINTSNYANCLPSTYASNFKGVGSLSWRSLARRMKYYSCSPVGVCWGIDTKYRVYITKKIIPTSCSAYHWTPVSGLMMKMIEVGTDGTVFGLTTSGRVYRRVGVTTSRPHGTVWRAISMCMPIRHLSYDLGLLWVVTKSGLLMQCSH